MVDIPPFPKDREQLTRALEQLGAPRLPGLLGIELLEINKGASRMRMEIGEKHLASNGYLHAASVVALADTTAGYGCVANLPDGAIGFTTIELKSNHLGTQLDGALLSEGSLAHGGRTTHVWDVVVTSEGSSKKIALFRCTQMILYPAA
jgi:1,4-dihydroxy-2-naphthoyl-CoA hydrolase